MIFLQHGGKSKVTEKSNSEQFYLRRIREKFSIKQCSLPDSVSMF